MELRPGAVIAGRYRVDRRIGAGGMGEVWAGEHVAAGVRVAVKTLLPAAACDPQIVARFRREAQLLGRIRSDRVARVIDFVEDRGLGLVLVMDYVEGASLAGELAARRLSVEEGIDLGVDIVAALCELHRARVVHRDLKPENIILEPVHGGRRRAVIVDFGLSRQEAALTGEEESLTGITQADVAVGTIPYMAPEQFLSSRDVSSAADLYAVGAILFRAVAGHHVYGDSEDLDYAKLKLTNDAPPLTVPRFDRIAAALRAIVARALSRRPEARFESAEAMLAELGALQEVARAMALDLEGATELGPPPSSLGALLAEDAGEQTRRMSRPPVPPAEDPLQDEVTLDSPGVKPPPPAPPAPVSAPTLSTAPPTVREMSMSSRFTQPSPEMPRATERAPMTMPRVVELRTAVAVVLGALAGGAALGFAAARLLGG
jgi:serine/threonine-protein kinase